MGRAGENGGLERLRRINTEGTESTESHGVGGGAMPESDPVAPNSSSASGGSGQPLALTFEPDALVHPTPNWSSAL
jgi:hypothetical protein